MTNPQKTTQCVLHSLKSVNIVLHYDKSVQAEDTKRLYKRLIQWCLLLFLFV